MKPKNCTCNYPAVLLRNMNGHDPSCPVYQEWKKEYDRRSQMNPQVVMATMNPSSPETKSPAEVARELAHAWFNRKEFIIDGNVILSASSNPEVLLADYVAAAITTALENERERCVKIAETEAQDAKRREAVSNDDFDRGRSWAARAIATAIRGK